MSAAISTLGMDRSAWLEARRKGIGGSDVAAIMGLNPYRSALGVYFDKIGQNPPFEGNLATELGLELEPFLRRKFEKWILETEGHQVEVEQEPMMLQHEKHEVLLANIDGKFLHPIHGWCGVELKTASEYMAEKWDGDELPDSYYLQIQHYLGVTGWALWYVVALIGNRKVVVKPVPRNESVIRATADFAVKWWEQYVVPKIAPAPDGSEDAGKMLRMAYQGGEEEPLVLDDMKGDYDRFKAVAADIKSLKEEQEQIKQRIMARMGNKETALINGRKCTWRIVTKAAHVVRESSTRQFNIY